MSQVSIEEWIVQEDGIDGGALTGDVYNDYSVQEITIEILAEEKNIGEMSVPLINEHE